MSKYGSDRKFLLEFIESNLLESGYRYADRIRVDQLRTFTYPVYSRNIAVGKNIYDLERKCHLILFHPRKWANGLVIEVRWQGVGGTVDEKFPFIVMNIKRSGLETVIVMGGEKLKPQVFEWVQSQIGYRLVEVFDPTQFQNWALEGNL